MRTVAEIACDSANDVWTAAKAGADRTELNMGLPLGGLTPSHAEMAAARKAPIAIISMVRPRGAGFWYDDALWEIMLQDAEDQLQLGADGIAFGCLQPDRTIDRARAASMIDLIHRFKKEAVFHRAFDLVPDQLVAQKELMDLGCDRILTSGGEPSAPEGTEGLGVLAANAMDRIEILAGAGVRTSHVRALFAVGVRQFHSSCKGHQEDPTTENDRISYAISSGEQALFHPVVDLEAACAFVQEVHGINESGF